MKKSDHTKQLLIEQLQKTPIVEAACQKVEVSRTTYYRYREDDPEFAKKADEAIVKGRSFVSDLAESQLINAVKERNLTAITYWLKSHHPDYATTIQVKHALQDEHLTPEQEALVREALRLASFTQTTIINDHGSLSPNSDPAGAADQQSPDQPSQPQERDPARTRGRDDQGQES